MRTACLLGTMLIVALCTCGAAQEANRAFSATPQAKRASKRAAAGTLKPASTTTTKAATPTTTKPEATAKTPERLAASPDSAKPGTGEEPESAKRATTEESPSAQQPGYDHAKQASAQQIEIDASDDRTKKPGKTLAAKPPLDEWGMKALEVIGDQVTTAKRMQEFDKASVIFLAGRALSGYGGKPSAAMMSKAWEAVMRYKGDERPGLDFLQSEIIMNLAQVDPDYLHGHLPSAQDVKDQALAAIVKEYSRRKRFDDAIEDAAKIVNEPYLSDGYRTLIQLMPKDDQLKIDNTFSSALKQVKRIHDRKRYYVGTADFAYLIYTAMDKVSYSLLLDACDEVIKRSGEASREFQLITDSRTFDLTLGQIRLFYLLPVLERIDPSRAESVRRHEKELSEILRNYPRGIADLDSDYDSRPFASRIRQASRRGPGVPSAALQPAALLSVSEMRALSDPNESTRLLVEYAQKSGDDPAMILDTLRGIADDMRYNEKVSARHYIDAARSAVKMPDGKGVAKDLLKKASRSVLGGFYADDKNGADPNLALKAYWPSTMAYQDIVTIADDVSHDFAWEMAKDITDDEIAAMAKVQLAAVWLKTPPFRGFSPMIAKRSRFMATTAP